MFTGFACLLNCDKSLILYSPLLCFPYFVNVMYKIRNIPVKKYLLVIEGSVPPLRCP